MEGKSSTEGIWRQTALGTLLPARPSGCLTSEQLFGTRPRRLGSRSAPGGHGRRLLLVARLQLSSQVLPVGDRAAHHSSDIRTHLLLTRREHAAKQAMEIKHGKVNGNLLFVLRPLKTFCATVDDYASDHTPVNIQFTQNIKVT
ncbi:hypothetical protein EYF80_010961 [Liparis tanakae]|uniref:Uncharacterized protein n=1 Tax=Liparis tanakae TaxID=230148 RepID=A0A4Z2ILX7_9TELE|nr:hypothetical protein EYF80_010961 [Liparis tanakae]